MLTALTDRSLWLQQLKKEALGEDSDKEDEDDEDGSEDSTDEEEVGSHTLVAKHDKAHTPAAVLRSCKRTASMLMPRIIEA